MSGRLTIWIDGREALPVRAIPYVGGWEHQYSPDVVAGSLARTIAPPFGKLRNLVAYHRPEGKPLPVISGEWKAVVAEVKGFEAELREQRPSIDAEDDHAGYAKWRKGAALKLPAGVFVWLDEFLREREDDRRRHHNDDVPVTLSPMLDDDTRAAVLKGFEDCSRQENDEHEKTYTLLGYHSAVARKFGSPDWDYWLSLPYWTPRDVACLLVELNPDRYDMVTADINPQPRRLVEHIATVERKATREQQAGQLCANPTPQQWAAWAGSSGYALPDRLLGARAHAEELPADSEDEGDALATETLTEVRIAAIVETAKKLNYNPLCVATGGKAIIKSECLEKLKGDPHRFTADTFKKAWQAARNAGLIDVENAETYRGR